MRQRLHRSVRAAEMDMHHTMDTLRSDMAKQIVMLERVGTKRDLTKEEQRLLTRLKKSLDQAEAALEKSLHRIGRS